MNKTMPVCVVCLIFFSVSALAQPITDLKYLKNTLDLIADKTLEAYNYEDHLGFFKYHSNTLSDLKTKQYFESLFISGYKDTFGNILSKKLVEKESSFDPYYPRLTYKVVCEKYSDVLVAINFQEEAGTYRINQITFDRIPKY